MSEAKPETIADIVSQIRAAAYLQNADSPSSVMRLANRIEAAWKREEATWKGLVDVAKELAEHEWKEANRRVEEVAKREHGNAAAMREALSAITTIVWEAEHSHIDADEAVMKIGEQAEAALAAPPRNCDAGTAEEQTKRFNDFCNATECKSCPIKNESGYCKLAWAQMPYKAVDRAMNGAAQDSGGTEAGRARDRAGGTEACSARDREGGTEACSARDKEGESK